MHNSCAYPTNAPQQLAPALQNYDHPGNCSCHSTCARRVLNRFNAHSPLSSKPCQSVQPCATATSCVPRSYLVRMRTPNPFKAIPPCSGAPGTHRASLVPTVLWQSSIAHICSGMQRTTPRLTAYRIPTTCNEYTPNKAMAIRNGCKFMLCICTLQLLDLSVHLSHYLPYICHSTHDQLSQTCSPPSCCLQRSCLCQLQSRSSCRQAQHTFRHRS